MFSIVTEARDQTPTRVSPRSRDPGNKVEDVVAALKIITLFEITN